MDLNEFWFLMLGLLATGYAILDGFDLGVGLLLPFIRGDHERRLAINSIGPLWDGNEVWLVTFGGALFAAFPEAYATVFSAFYLAVMVLLFALIGRAVSIEFRSKSKSKFWRSYWDYSLYASSFFVPLLFGILAGALLRGIPLREDHQFYGSLFELVTWHSLLCGLLAVSVAVMHGSHFLYLKTEDELQARVGRLRYPAYFVFLALLTIVSVDTLLTLPGVLTNFETLPAAWSVVVLAGIGIVGVPIAMQKQRPGFAFAASCVIVMGLVFNFGMALFPNLVPAVDPAHSLHIHNAASSELTLRLLRIIAFIGMPFVLTYTAAVYWIFRGKTKLDDFSY